MNIKMINCPYCGRQLVDSALVCKYCSNRLDQAPDQISGANPLTKKCPYCAEEILKEAIVCKHCGKDLKNKRSWIGGVSFIVFSISISAAMIEGNLFSPWLLVAIVSLVILIYWLVTGRIKYFG